MNISEKIDEIRQKPEHIRMRYVWGAVSVSMLFIVIIWIFSLSESFKNIKPIDSQALPDLKQNIDDLKSIKDAAPSVNDMMNSVSNNSGEGVEANGQPEQNQASPTNDSDKSNKSESISNMPQENPDQNNNSDKPVLPIE